MRKLLLLFILTLPIVTASYSIKIKQWVFPEKGVAKNFNIKIGNINNYKSKAYAHSTLKLNISLLKLKGNEIDTLMSETSPEIKLNHVHSFAKTFVKDVQVANVLESKEQLILFYTIVYKTKGSVLEVPNASWLQKGELNKNVLINL